PIRVTSPGLTVYKGGAITPRVYFIRQSLGPLKVNRQMIDVSVSYTPSRHVQLEAEVPIARTSFRDGVTSGSATGFGNVTLWTKYRFFRQVKTFADRQERCSCAESDKCTGFCETTTHAYQRRTLTAFRSRVLTGRRAIYFWRQCGSYFPKRKRWLSDGPRAAAEHGSRVRPAPTRISKTRRRIVSDSGND